MVRNSGHSANLCETRRAASEENEDLDGIVKLNGGSHVTAHCCVVAFVRWRRGLLRIFEMGKPRRARDRRDGHHHCTDRIPVWRIANINRSTDIPANCREEERGGKFMESSIRLDHTATWNEVCEALAFSSLSDLRAGRAPDSDNEGAPDFGAGVGFLAEDLAWMALARKVQDGRWN